MLAARTEGEAFRQQPDIPQIGDPITDYEVATSPANRELLNISPLRMYLAFDKSPNRLIGNSLDAFIETARRDVQGSIVTNPDDANAIIFATEYEDDVWSMLKYRSQYKKGTTGIAFTSVEQMPTGPDLARFGRQYLGNAFSPNGVILEGDPNATVPRAARPVSMEIGAGGLVDFEAAGETEGFRQLALRMTHLAGAKHAVNHEYVENSDKAFKELWQNSMQARELIIACQMMDRDNLLRYEGLDSMKLRLDMAKRRGVRQFLEKGGLSEGQARTPMDILLDGIDISGSGVDKSNLSRDQVVLIKRIKRSRDGVVTERPKGVDKVEPSVESLDNMAFSLARAGIVSGELTSSNIQLFVEFLNDEGRIAKAAAIAGPDPYTVIHTHKWPEKWGKRILMADMNRKLIPQQGYQTGCGTWALAAETSQALMELMLKDEVAAKTQAGELDELSTLGVFMDNHGVTFLVPGNPIAAEQKIVNQMRQPGEEQLIFAASGVPRR